MAPSRLPSRIFSYRILSYRILFPGVGPQTYELSQKITDDRNPGKPNILKKNQIYKKNYPMVATGSGSLYTIAL